MELVPAPWTPRQRKNDPKPHITRKNSMWKVKIDSARAPPRPTPMHFTPLMGPNVGEVKHIGLVVWMELGLRLFLLFTYRVFL